ncbi:MAG TPA: hypothetical protein VII69_09415 [Candidatus Eremiobacteraceae bacterium]
MTPLPFSNPPPRGPLHRREFAAFAAFVAATFLAMQISAGAPINPVAIVANLGGALTVRDATGVSHDVSGAQPLRSGDTVMTGINALASISLAGSLRARIGSGTVAQYYPGTSSAGASLRLSAGALCVADGAAGVTVAAGGTALTSVGTPAIFDIATGHDGTTIVLYTGSVTAVASGSKPNVVRGPAAFAALPGGQFIAAPFDTTAATLASMPCPDRDAARSTALALASPLPLPSPTVAPSSGGGGGGILGVLAGIVGLAALAGGHGGGGGGGTSNPPPAPSPTPNPSPSPSPSPSPGTLEVSPKSLTFLIGGNSQTVNASESDYTGPISVSSPNPAIANVSPPSSLSPAVFTVTPVGAGNTSFVVSDNHGGAITVSISVAISGALTVSPLDFQTQPINSPPLLLHVSESNYSGPFSVTSDHTNIVTVGGGGNGPTPPPFTVTPTQLAAGHANITVSDSLNNTKIVPITIAGPIVNNPSVLNAITVPTPFVSTDAFYTGPLTAISSDDTVATVSGGGPGPGPVTFTVTPHAQGNAVITVSDTLLQTATVPVSVSTGGLVLNPTSLTFDNPTDETQPFNATEPNYTGNITTSGCPTTVVTVTPPIGHGPSQNFTVKSVGPGNCVLTVATGDNTQNETITVFGDLGVAPSNLNYTDVGVDKQVDVTETNYTGPFSIAANTCAGIADVGQPSSGGPSATIDVTSSVSLSGGSCSFQVDDDHGGSQPVFVTVGPFGLPAPLPSTLTLNIVNHVSDTIAVSETGYSGQFTPSSSDCNGIATFPSEMGTSFLITEAAAGTCHINFADDHGGSTPATIVVDGKLTLAPIPIDFTDINITLPVHIDEANYADNFTVANDNCNGVVATVGLPLGPGPSTTLNVTSLKQGLCTFAVVDDEGQSVTETVNVGPFGLPTANPTEIQLNTAGPLQGTFMVSETGYSGDFNLTLSSACSGLAGVSPGSGSSATTFTVTATGSAVGTCGIRIADDMGQTGNVEVEVAGGTISVTPAALPFVSSTSPPQTVAASDAGATAFTCVSSDPVNVDATITTQSVGAATCTVGPTNTNPGFIGQTQVTFADSLPGSSAVVQVGVGMQPLSKHHRAVAGGVKRTLPGQKGPLPPVVARPFPNSNGSAFEVSTQQLTLQAPNGRQTIEANVSDYRGAILASSSAARVVDVSVSPGDGPVRFITFTAKTAGSAIVRISDERGNARYVRVVVVVPAGVNKPLPNPRPGGPPLRL